MTDAAAQDPGTDDTADGAADGAGPGRTAGDLVRTGIRGVGQALITVGVVLLLFVFYTLYVTNLFTARDQSRLNDDLDEVFAQQQAQPVSASQEALRTPPLGAAFARLYLPTLGKGLDDPLAVVQGVGTDDLKKGPGHLPSSQLPGQIGNLVISGHRTTYGAPFNELDELQTGDAVVVETATRFYTYRVTGREIVPPSAFEVTYPVPRQPRATPSKRLITLTTCNPKYSAKQRLIVYGELDAEDAKTTGATPVALERG